MGPGKSVKSQSAVVFFHLATGIGRISQRSRLIKTRNVQHTASIEPAIWAENHPRVVSNI